MPRKTYPKDIDRPSLAVKEAEPKPYGRRPKSSGAVRTKVSVAALKRKIKTPAKRSERDIAWALDIAGIGAGPSDLSSRASEYLRKR